MRSAWNMDRLRRPRIIRGMAALFLLFTLVDIVSPPACCERAELLSAAHDNYSRLAAGAADETSSVAVSSQSETEHSPDKNCCDEDSCLRIFAAGESARLRIGSRYEASLAHCQRCFSPFSSTGRYLSPTTVPLEIPRLLCSRTAGWSSGLSL